MEEVVFGGRPGWLLAGILALISTSAFAQTNVAPTGTAYRWAHNVVATANTNRATAPGLNDGDLSGDVNLSGGSQETDTVYEAGGIIWSSPQTIAEVQFIGGTWTTLNDGAFCNHLTLQTTSDGTTWTESGWTVSPAYPYDRSTAAGVTYTFSGSAAPTVLGVRISGQAHCRNKNSDWGNVRELLAFNNGAPDTTPPTAPGNLTANAASATQVNLGWTASSDDVGVANYLIYRNGGQVGAVTSAHLSYQDSGLSPSTTYTYTVKAQDASGNVSSASNTASATTAAGSACTPDITIPSANGTIWPDSCTTGASNSLGALTNVTGDITLDQDGQIYSNVRVDGSITVTACNVQIENVEVDAGVPLNGDSTPDVFPIWLKHPENCNVTLDHVSVIAKPAPNVYVTNAIRVAFGGSVTITNSKILGAQLGITVATGSIKDSYAVLGSNMRGDHNENILGTGTTGLTIEHNTFLNPNSQTAVLALFTDFGPNQNVVVRNNLLAGGGYTCYCGDGLTDDHGNPTPAMNVSFLNNVFWELYYPAAGFFGSGLSYSAAGGGAWTGNLYMSAGGALTGQSVPQPGPAQ